MAEPFDIFFAGGGSGGHLYPGIAVAEELATVLPDARPVFLCTEREIDATILDATGYDYITQPIVPPRKSVGGLLRFWTKWRATNEQVRRLIDERKPKVVLGLGGYAAGACIKLAEKADVPAAMLNPDVVPGKANQYLFASCSAIFCGYDATLDHVPSKHKGKCQVTGCPLRRSVVELPKPEVAAERLDLDPNLNTLLITGASQGAKSVNDAMLEVAKRMEQAGGDRPMQGWQILHLAGSDHAADVREGYRKLGYNGRAKVVDFTPNMADIWAVSDLAVARSGAGNCAELAAAGVPSVLMPYPYHKDLHQLSNAKQLEEAGAATVLTDTKNASTNANALLPALEALLYDAERRKDMSEAASKLGKPHAARAVAEAIAALVP